MLKSINNKSVHEAPRDHHKAIAAKYDAAQTHAGNEKHWAQADALSSGAALTPLVREKLRNRARYECANNSFASGIVETLATDTIGTGPRLQLKTEDRAANVRVERAFAAWANEIHLTKKLHTLRMTKTRDGEGFAVLGTNPTLRNPVQLDLRCVEAEQFSDPSYRWDRSESDGIIYDAWGNPTSYSMLTEHPGGLNGYRYSYKNIPAQQVIHYFKSRRPGQLRGAPDITPALPLFAMLRRYTLAVVTAAEIAADLAGILFTDAAADEDGYDIDPLDTFEVVRGMFTSMPAGWKMEQLRAEQPTSTYGEFRDKILNEIARCLNMPFNVAAGNSADYNYASGRLDHQTYYRAIHVDRHEINGVVLDHLWRAWLDEAALIEGLLPREMRQVDADLIPHGWHWDGFKHVDPAKESKGEETMLKTGALTYPDLYASKGQDWEEQQDKQAKALGVSVDEYRKLLRESMFGTTPAQPAEPDQEEEEQEEEAEVEPDEK